VQVPFPLACRRARAGQGQALRWPQTRPALTAPARGGGEIDGWDGRMAPARL